MSESQDTWKEIQVHKSKQLSLREKLAMRKKAREEVVAEIIGGDSTPTAASSAKVSTAAQLHDLKPDIKREIGEFQLLYAWPYWTNTDKGQILLVNELIH